MFALQTIRYLGGSFNVSWIMINYQNFKLQFVRSTLFLHFEDLMALFGWLFTLNELASPSLSQ